MARFDRPELAVVKVGSSSLHADGGRLDDEQIRRLADEILRARGEGTAVVVVTSGAVAVGIGRLGLERRPGDLPTLQACAAAGQGELMHTYQRHLLERGLSAAQILLSPDDFVRRTRYLNARTTLERLLELDAVPIINENDAVATEELAYGDNDHLAALVTSMLDADLLLLLSDVPGLYDVDPRQNDDARLIDRVDDLESLDWDQIGGTGSHVGSGGMRTKVESARVAVASAAHAVVADARRRDVVADVLAGKSVGTWFVAQPKRVEARRLWIGFALTPHGQVRVDAGAVTALRQRGTSLLAVGVTGVDGEFAAGDAIEIVGPDDEIVARGLSSFDAGDIARIAGRTTSEVVDELGPGYAREVVHRDDLVVLPPGARSWVAPPAGVR